ncbi:YajG family lipoprotein [Pleionea sp. CnH1-48]|uniref:YajG family lipoprotein n=1 Tax=Pleionea sp. CnH1-48 TaxID=2954494 RepID=UPI00209715C5|nr:YajG family lipoprotein [Pleionea sp. CnH1-48]MCO7226813.1 YajG family lipoprotein [Pleionea sp. CnH1-48]
MKYWLLIITLLLTTSCANRPTQFTIDPEINLSQLAKAKDTHIMLSIVGPQPQAASTSEEVLLNSSNNFTSTIKQSFIKALTKKGYKISSNKHFSDVILELDFSNLKMAIKPGLVKDSLEANGKLSLKLTKKPHSLSKSFSRSQTLMVAGRANDAEVTGLANDLIGNLLSRALTDPQIIAFLNKPAAQ